MYAPVLSRTGAAHVGASFRLATSLRPTSRSPSRADSGRCPLALPSDSVVPLEFFKAVTLGRRPSRFTGDWMIGLFLVLLLGIGLMGLAIAVWSSDRVLDWALDTYQNVARSFSTAHASGSSDWPTWRRGIDRRRRRLPDCHINCRSDLRTTGTTPDIDRLTTVGTFRPLTPSFVRSIRKGGFPMDPCGRGVWYPPGIPLTLCRSLVSRSGRAGATRGLRPCRPRSRAAISARVVPRNDAAWRGHQCPAVTADQRS